MSFMTFRISNGGEVGGSRLRRDVTRAGFMYLRFGSRKI